MIINILIQTKNFVMFILDPFWSGLKMHASFHIVTIVLVMVYTVHENGSAAENRI